MSAPILIVEDDAMQQQMLKTLLHRKLGYEAHSLENGQKALDYLASNDSQNIELIIMDLNMPVMGGLEALEIIHHEHPHIPVIVLTGSNNVEDAVKALKLGAIDFLMKPYNGDRMATTVKNTLKLSTLSKDVNRLKRQQDGAFIFKSLIGHNQGLAETIHQGRKAALSNITILITGETGTGKEVFSRAIHGESNRADKPFIAVNCGAIPEQLVESVLFGHEKGAFTGATEKAIGKFRKAEGGTIFLDEVGELPLDTQVKLLRVLQQKEVEPVGAAKAVPVNIRVISATNRDLEQEVAKGTFREDLYFRLNVLQIELPPLRNRKSDIVALAEHFIKRFCAQNNLPPKTIDEKGLHSLMAHDWPGNIRELENTINRAIVVSESSVLQFGDSGLNPVTNNTSSAPITPIPPTKISNTVSVLNKDGSFKTVAQLEEEAMHLALDHFNGNITQAAKALGMAKSTFYKKYKKNARAQS